VIELLPAVLASSLVGSVHCAAMCGPLVALAHGDGSRWRPPLAHAAGRGAAYVALGALAGGVGGALDLAGQALAVQRVAWLLGAATVLATGLVGLSAALGAPLRLSGGRTFQRGLVQIRRRRPVVRAALLGLLSAALPCGWLWAFVALAAGTAHPAAGAAVMATFWLGTLPMNLGLGVALGPLLVRLRRRLPLVSAGLLIALGCLALVLRAPVPSPPAAATATVPAEPACHGHH
jgi:sulfite exporter TauE/SafE